ncbi:N-acyl homoserine lactonase [Bienertia sinuspersici]
METNLEPPNSASTSTSTSTTIINGDSFLSPPNSTSQTTINNDDFYIDDSNCSTPYVSAPSSPGRYSYVPPSGFFYSAPASPMHFILATAPSRSSLLPATSDASSNSNNSFEFEFSARFDSPAPEIGSSMSSADELFLNGQIRPMKLCAHLQRPQKLPSMTLLESGRENDEDDYDDDGDVFQRSSRDLRFRSRSQRRRTRSLSPLRSTTPFDWKEEERENGGANEGNVKEEKENGGESETTPSGSSSRCSSAGRSSKRWVFLKDFLRSKSEGRSNNKFWHNINISFSPAKEKREKGSNENANTPSFMEDRKAKKKEAPAAKGKGNMTASKRRSAHEMHYAANRAQAEEMRKKTFLPYRQGLLGCLGFNSKSYGALNGFARALNPVSSR